MTDIVKKQIPEIVVPGQRLGRHVEHDPRSRDHAFGAVVALHELTKVHHRRFGHCFDQGDLGSCTGNAVAGAINTAPLHRPHSVPLTETDAVNLYELATVLDGYPGQYPPDDTGSSGLAAAKAAVQKGFITSYKHAFSVDEALTALQIGPVITGVDWYEGFDSPDANGLVRIAGQVRGGHEFEAIAFEPALKPEDSLVEFENSWSTSWGKRGRFYMTVSTWRTLLEAQGDATILVR